MATSTWNLQGNANTTTTNFLGTSDSQPLVVKTANTERLRIDVSGNIGVGTSTPGAKLGVDPQGEGGIKVGGTDGSQLDLTVSNQNGRAEIQSWVATTSGPDGPTPLPLPRLNPVGITLSRTANLALNPFGGNVGIGTHSPGAELDVAGNLNVSGSANVASLNAAAISASNPNGTPITAQTATGAAVSATSESGEAIYANSTSGIGVVANSSSNAGLNAGSDSSFAVIATSGSGIAIRAQANTDTAVFATTTTGWGVDARSTNGVGVNASSDTNIGLNAASGSGIAIRAQASSDTAVFATSNSGRGIDARSTSGIGIYGTGGQFAGYFDGSIVVTGDVFLTGADCAEHFDVVRDEPLPDAGTVVVIDHDGHLRESRDPYDKKVAGVVSGAGEYRHAIVLDKRASDDCRVPIALVGKVYCKVDAQYAPIGIGDMLTSSPTPGHAMKVSEQHRAFGAILGKALKALDCGTGLIPVLVALQ